MSEELQDRVDLPIEWQTPDQTVSRYATNLLVQHTDQEFYIAFYELRPPMVIGTPDEQKKQLEEIGHITAECIANIIVSPERMENFVKALQTNLDRYKARLEGEE